MPLPEIIVSKKKAICTVQMNRPQQKNAINEAMYGAMADALIDADADPSVRVVLVKGSNDCFTAGNDLREFLENPPESENSPGFVFLKTLAALKKPLVAAVNGPAVGIGTTMLLHCDFVFAGKSALFSLPFINLGLCPEAASSLLLPQNIGHRRAAELLMLGEPFDALTAEKYSIINTVCPDAEVEKIAMDTAQKLATKPPVALMQTKKLLKAGMRSAVEKTLYSEIEIFARLLHSPEAKAAMQTFLQKSRK